MATEFVTTFGATRLLVRRHVPLSKLANFIIHSFVSLQEVII